MAGLLPFSNEKFFDIVDFLKDDFSSSLIRDFDSLNRVTATPDWVSNGDQETLTLRVGKNVSLKEVSLSIEDEKTLTLEYHHSDGSTKVSGRYITDISEFADPSTISAKLEDGKLVVTVDKLPEFKEEKKEKVRNIEIKKKG